MNDQDDFDDFDSGLTADNGSGGGEDRPEGTSALKEAWNTNPLLKVGAVVLGLAVLYVGYSFAFKGEEEVVNKASVNSGNIGQAKIIPGQETTDIVYNEAIKDKNNQDREAAEATGESTIPMQVAAPSSNGIDLPEAKNQGSEDPLAEWRARKEENTMKEDTLDTLPQLPELPETAQPDVTPMTNPQRPNANAGNKLDPNAVKLLSQQMRTILGAQVPPQAAQLGVTTEDSPYEKQKQAIAQAEKAGAAASANGAAIAATTVSADGTTTTGTTDQAAKAKVIVPAGNIVYAQLMNELNSDIKGPALAQIMSGPFTGGRAIGAFEMQDEYLVISFTRIIKDGVSYTIDGIALDEKTTLAAHQTTVDSHYFTRIVLPAAAKFVEGYAGAVAETGTETQVTTGGGAVQSTAAPSPRESLYAGLEEGASKSSEILEASSERPITVTVAKGTTMGILMMASVTTASAEE